MNWKEEYENRYDGIDHASYRDNSSPDKESEEGLAPIDIVNSVDAYLLLSNDALG